jgi:hypothetical protein
MANGFNPPDYDAPLAVPSGSSTEVDGVPQNYAPPAVPPAPATEVDGVPVDWDPPLAVPSGSSTTLNNSSYLVTVTATGDVGDEWTLWTNGVPVQYTVGSDEWVLTITAPGAEDDVWQMHVGLQTASYTVLLGDDASDVAAGLDAAVEALTGVYSSSSGAAVTFGLDSHANLVPSASTDGAGTFTLSGAAAKDTATQVAAGLEVAFDAVLDQGAHDFDVARAGAALTVTRDDPGYLSVRLETDGSGTSTLSSTGTAMDYDPQPIPQPLTAEVDGVPMSATHDDPAAVPSGSDWVLTQS